MDVHEAKHYVNLVEFIKTARAQGLPDGQIQKSLQEVGWSEHDVAAGFGFVDQDAISLIHAGGPEAVAHPLLFHKHWRQALAGGIGLVIIIALTVSGRSYITTISDWIRSLIPMRQNAEVAYTIPTQTTSTKIVSLLQDETVTSFAFAPAGTKNFYLKTNKGRTIGEESTPQASTNPYADITLVTQGIKTGFAASGVPFGKYFDYVQLPELSPVPAAPFVPENLSNLPYIASEGGVFFVVQGTQTSPTYDAILKLWIAPDGKNIAYSALKNCSIHPISVVEKIKRLSTKNCDVVVVTNTKEIPVKKIPALGAFSLKDNSFAFVTADEACQENYQKGIDPQVSCNTQVITEAGQQSPVFDFVRSFGFLQNGTLVYNARVADKEAVFVGGVSRGEFSGINARQIKQPQAFPTGIISTDSKRLIYAAVTAGQEALFIDDIQLPVYAQVLAVSYGSDGHTAYYAAVDDTNTVVLNTVKF